MANTVYAMPEGHPCLAGHFPGRPLVPGVALLDALAEAAGPLEGFDSVRFLAPVRPDDAVALAWTSAGVGLVDFTGHVAGRLVIRGRARVRV